MNNIQLEPVETVMEELHCSRRQAYAHMKKMRMVRIGHGMVTRESLEQYKRDRIIESAYAAPRRAAPTKRPHTAPPPAGKGTVQERYPRIRKERSAT